MDTAVYLSLSDRKPGEDAGRWISRARAEFFAKHDLVLLRKEDWAWTPCSVATLCGGEQAAALPFKVDPVKAVPLLPRIVQARREHRLPILVVDSHTLV